MNEDMDREAAGAALLRSVRLTRGPIVGWIVLCYGGTVIMQSLQGLEVIPLLFYSGLMLLHASLLWHSEQLTGKHPWLYFLIQALIVNGSGLLMPHGAPLNLVALNPVMIGQSLIVYPKNRLAPVLCFAGCGALFCVMAAITGNSISLLLPFFLLMTVVVTAITRLALRQYQDQLRTRTFLAELEIAHSRVEELTIANERQRMARDLHDTLAQGLAGLVMQLEAVDAHLSADNAARAREIVGLSMDRARRTLAEARQVIDNLRVLSAADEDFAQAVTGEIRHYQDETGIPVHLELEPGLELSKLLTEHFLHIVRECLANAARHADADRVWIRMHRNAGEVRMEIRDNGQGFDPAQIGRHPGHYGLLGIRERVRIIGGSFAIDSGPDGTTIAIEAPLKKGVE